MGAVPARRCSYVVVHQHEGRGKCNQLCGPILRVLDVVKFTPCNYRVLGLLVLPVMGQVYSTLRTNVTGTSRRDVPMSWVLHVVKFTTCNDPCVRAVAAHHEADVLLVEDHNMGTHDLQLPCVILDCRASLQLCGWLLI